MFEREIRFIFKALLSHNINLQTNLYPQKMSSKIGRKTAKYDVKQNDMCYVGLSTPFFQ